MKGGVTKFGDHFRRSVGKDRNSDVSAQLVLVRALAETRLRGCPKPTTHFIFLVVSVD